MVTLSYIPSSIPSRTSSASNPASSTSHSSPGTAVFPSPFIRYGMPYSPSTSRMGSRVDAFPTNFASLSWSSRWL